MDQRYRVETVHGEHWTLFHVVDTAQPPDEQPAVLATYHQREPAQERCKILNDRYSHWPIKETNPC